MTECDNKCRTCMNYKCRCESCACLEENENGEWVCGDNQVPCERVQVYYNYDE